MLRKFAVIVIILMLTGCNDNETMDDFNQELSEIQDTYENKVIDLEQVHGAEIEKLKKFYIDKLALSESNSGESGVEKFTDEDIEKLISDLEKLKRIIFYNDRLKLYDDIQIDNKVIKIHSEGTDILEDGIICVLEVYDYNGNVIWKRLWEELDVTELETYSPVTVYNDRLYVVVDGKLMGLNLNTGEDLWNPIEVGHPNHAPRISENGDIYVTGQYGPFLTSISSEGIVNWQYKSSDMSYSADIALINSFILVEYIGGIAVFDENGEVIEMQMGR